jgi:hypothetical protein
VIGAGEAEMLFPRQMQAPAEKITMESGTVDFSEKK